MKYQKNGGSCTTMSFIIYIHHWTDQIKQNEVGRACGMRGIGEKISQDFGGKAGRRMATQKTEA
jgi:hypothetical protein